MVEYRDIRLWADRVWIVKRWLEHPGLWPDGIDSKYERWYSGHEDEWRELTKHLDAQGQWVDRLNDEAAHGRWAGGGVREAGGRPRIVEGEPWVEAGVSRRTWYRRLAAVQQGGAGEP